MPGINLDHTFRRALARVAPTRFGGLVEGLAYYTYLATTVPPSELASLPWRRLRAAARRRIENWTPRPTALDIATSLGAGSLDALALRFRELRAARVAIEPYERAEARKLISTWLPGHAHAVTREGDRILDGQLLLFGRWRDHTRGELAPGIAALDWTRNPLNSGHAPHRPSGEIDRDAPGSDSRAIWEAARLNVIYRLAQAHVLRSLPGTEDSRGASDPSIYARAAMLHLRDFIATQPVGFGIHWTCAMEAALRLMNFVPAILLLHDAPELDSCFWGEFLESVLTHARFIVGELEDTQTVPGNHLLTDLAGLVTVGCLLPELPGAMRWRTWGLQTFSQELLRQTTREGLAFEASLPYHRFTTELGLYVHSIAHRQGLSLEPPALTRLWQMCEATDHITLPDGGLPSIGDNDSTRAFSVIARGPLETAPLGALQAALDGPARAGTIEPEALWLAGIGGFQRCLRRVSPDRPRLHRFAISGLTVLRAEGGRAATLWAGDNGQHGLGGHAHNDKLSSEVVLRGHRLTIDPGCPTYIADPVERDRYRSTALHPTVQIDQLEQGAVPAGRPFLLPETTHARTIRADNRTAWGEHRGYLRVKPGILHRREVALPANPDLVCVTDWLLGEGTHVVDVHWPLTTADVTLRPANEQERVTLLGAEREAYGESRFDLDRVFALGDGESTVAILAVACERAWEATLSFGAFSPGYGERIRNCIAGIRLRTECPVAVTSAFVWVADARVHELTGLEGLTKTFPMMTFISS